MRAIAFSLAALIGVSAELKLIPAILTAPLPHPLPPLVAFAERPLFPWVLCGAALLAMPLEAVAVRRGVGSRFTALAGTIAAMALYLPGRIDRTDTFGSIALGLIFSLFAGGGVGLALGALARWLTGSRV